MRLEGKVAFVTGASRGIGKAIAIGFAREGARVVLAARSEVKKESGLEGTIHETAEAIRAIGGEALPIVCDVTDEASISSAINGAVSKLGPIDILVNNAGVAFFHPISETPLKRWETVLKVNLTGAFLCTKAVLPRMIERKTGSIVNISSLAADERDNGTVATGVAYAVAKANINMPAALLAAAALLFDYVMTVAVSIAAGVAAITSVVAELLPLRVELALIAIALLTVANLRGLRESGNIFAVPTYVFVFGALGMIALGLVAVATGDRAASFPTPRIEAPPGGFELVTVALLVRAFAFGSVALTGTEAISNGVPAFKPPEPRNAANTLTIMALLLGAIFVGISLLAAAYGLVPNDRETLISQVSRTVYGDGPIYLVFQAATARILLLAANTGYNGAPRLAQILAIDGYLPRQVSIRGGRLAFVRGAAHREDGDALPDADGEDRGHDGGPLAVDEVAQLLHTGR